MVRLLINALHSKSGGGVTYLRNMLPLMAGDSDVDLHVCVHETQKESLPNGLNGVTVHRLEFQTGFWRLQFHEQIAVPRLAKKIGADVTFSPANYGPLMAPNSVILLRNALSVAFVERRPVKIAYWALLYVGTLLSLLASKRAITVSDYARRAAGLIGLFKNRLTVIPHGVSKEFSPPNKGTEREGFLLAVSDIYVQKNLKTLILALARLIPDHGGLTLKIAGHPVDWDYFAELKQTVAREGLDGKVEFLGAVPPKELADLYRRCGVFVFPSTVETFGNPLVEAMASGAPIACSEAAAMPEVAGDAAVYFDPKSVDNMALAVGGLLKDAEKRLELSQKAVKRAKEFSWKKTAERTLVVLREAAAS